MIAKLRVGCTVAGCAPGVRTIVRSVLFHCITSSIDPTAESAYEEALYTSDVAQVSASEVQSRSMGFSLHSVCVKAVERDVRSSRLAHHGDFDTDGYIPYRAPQGGLKAGIWLLTAAPVFSPPPLFVR